MTPKIIRGSNKEVAFAYQVSWHYAALTALYAMDVCVGSKKIILEKQGNNTHAHYCGGSGGLGQDRSRTTFSSSFKTNLDEDEAIELLLNFFNTFYSSTFYLDRQKCTGPRITDRIGIHSGTSWTIEESIKYNLKLPKKEQILTQTTIQLGEVIQIPIIEFKDESEKYKVGVTHFTVTIDSICASKYDEIIFNGSMRMGGNWQSSPPQDIKLLEKYSTLKSNKVNRTTIDLEKYNNVLTNLLIKLGYSNNIFEDISTLTLNSTTENKSAYLTFKDGSKTLLDSLNKKELKMLENVVSSKITLNKTWCMNNKLLNKDSNTVSYYKSRNRTVIYQTKFISKDNTTIYTDTHTSIDSLRKALKNIVKEIKLD